MESLVMEACGNCQNYANGTTTLLKAAVAADAEIIFPVVKFLDGAPPPPGSRFVAVLVVPGLVVIQRKPVKQLGAYEKVMASSVFDSWPIFAIVGAMTLSAALVIWVLELMSCYNGFLLLCYRYGDRTPKSNPAKVFAMMWFLVGLVMFGLFAGAVTSALTVVVVSGGPEDTEYNTVEELVEALRTGDTDANLVRYVCTDEEKRLIQRLKPLVAESEEESLVFFEPASPFFVLILQVCGGALGGLILCGIIYEAFRWKWGKNEQKGRHCQDEEEMRKLVEEFYRDFTRTYKTLRKKSKYLIKLRNKLHTDGTIYMNNDVEDAKLW
ncbi:hypothetical protein OS493_038529 [Desmophyllum pertusum]|uniref:Uncharacterized protein n=1 Tax=Desmophyllum pertusum TaxID=174260 RepID=A0A9W9Y6X7_9CNID|nr:hypothetical protein OS493_038529 [Desmophyllum pertusum]